MTLWFPRVISSFSATTTVPSLPFHAASQVLPTWFIPSWTTPGYSSWIRAYAFSIFNQIHCPIHGNVPFHPWSKSHYLPLLHLHFKALTENADFHNLLKQKKLKSRGHDLCDTDLDASFLFNSITKDSKSLIMTADSYLNNPSTYSPFDAPPFYNFSKHFLSLYHDLLSHENWNKGLEGGKAVSLEAFLNITLEKTGRVLTSGLTVFLQFVRVKHIFVFDANDKPKKAEEFFFSGDHSPLQLVFRTSSVIAHGSGWKTSLSVEILEIVEK